MYWRFHRVQLRVIKVYKRVYLYNITTRSLLYYGSITSKANLYVFGISRFTKNHQYKIRWRRRDLFVCNWNYLFVIGIVTSNTFCGIYILFGNTFSLFSVFWLVYMKLHEEYLNSCEVLNLKILEIFNYISVSKKILIVMKC